jgi:hypothetical protein
MHLPAEGWVLDFFGDKWGVDIQMPEFSVPDHSAELNTSLVTTLYRKSLPLLS